MDILTNKDVHGNCGNYGQSGRKTVVDIGSEKYGPCTITRRNGVVENISGFECAFDQAYFSTFGGRERTYHYNNGLVFKGTACEPYDLPDDPMDIVGIALQNSEGIE